jgi:hypothetical protein
VTPDLVGQNGGFNLVGEVKKELPADKSLWLQDVKQVEKYDDQLTNWPLHDVDKHDLLLLTHHLRSTALSDYIQEQIKQKSVVFNFPISILEFVRNSERQTFWNLKKIWGSLSHLGLDTKLRNGIGVPGSKIVRELSSIKFYDAEPAIVYTMSLIWDHIFPEKATPEKFREAEGKKTVEILITIDEVHEKLKLYFAPEKSAYPRRKWISNALWTFQKIGLARREEGRYTILYHRIEHGELLEYFAKQLVEKAKEMKLTDLPQTEE